MANLGLFLLNDVQLQWCYVSH